AELLPLEQEAITALVDLYLDVLKRIDSPLQDVQKLLDAGKALETLLAEFIPKSVTLSYSWSPILKNADPIFKIQPDGALTIDARVTTYFDGKAPEFSVDGKLTNFTINLIGTPEFISVNFEQLNFHAHSGSKADCDVRIRRVDLQEA